MGTGPFNIAMGDSQEIILAYVVAEGNDNFNSIRNLKEQIPYLQDLANNNFDFESLAVANSKSHPNYFIIYQNFPNPFNPNTTIKYELEEDCNVLVNIYNISGNLVNTIQNGYRVNGSHTIQWNGTDRHGNLVPAGIYLYQLKAGDFVQTKKMVLMK